MNLSNQLLGICLDLSEGLETDNVEKWTLVVRQIKKGLLPKLKDIRSETDPKAFRKRYSEILKDFAEIAKLMGVPSIQSEVESFARAVSLSKPKKDAKVILQGSVEALVNKIKNEILSSPPSKSNVFLAMRLVNDIAKILFINEKKLFNKAVKLQVVYDSAIRSLFTKRIKPEFY